MKNAFLRHKTVAERLGISHWTLRRMWRRGQGPARRQLSPRVDGCTELDLQNYLNGMATRFKPQHDRKHGRCGTVEYRAWHNMKQRCLSPGHPKYRLWGGRGITVCERWRNSFAAFLADMGDRPSPHHSIDRIDDDGHYEPGNVRWATASEQRRNRRGKDNGRAPCD
jgi:hypothetical protein